MAGPASRLTATQRIGLSYLDRLMPLLSRLHDAGAGRDKAGNRRLFYDQYVGLLLVYFFSPAVESLRGLVAASELTSVQKRLGCPRASLGSLSEARQVFDPELLAPLVAELADRLPPGEDPDGSLTALAKTVTAVDGTLLKALPQITQACYRRRTDAGFRLHTHFEVLKGTATRITLTDGSNAGDASEKAVLKAGLRPDRLYVLDRGYEQFALFNAVVAAGSGYVCRVKAAHRFAPAEVRELTDADRQAGVVEDAVGVLGSENSRRIEHPDHSVRRLVLSVPVHANRTRRGRALTGVPGDAAMRTLVVVTSELDAPAAVIAGLYRHRWAIELYFRTLKHLLGCRHLLSRHPEGITIQCYVAIIACLLLALAGGKKPTLRTYEMVCFYFMGWATIEELTRHLEKLATN